MRKNRKQNHAMFVVCEALEQRQLLTAFQLLVDGKAVAGETTVNYGTVAQGASNVTHNMSFKYLGDQSVSIRADVGSAIEVFEQSSGDTGTKTLTKNQSFSVTYRLLTGLAATRLANLTFFFSESSGATQTRSHALTGKVTPGNLGGADNYGSMTNGSKNRAGSIKAIQREDDDGNTCQGLVHSLNNGVSPCFVRIMQVRAGVP